MNWRAGVSGLMQRLEFAGATAAAITLICLIVGQSAERYVEGAAPVAVAVADPNPGAPRPGTRAVPIFNAIDYATTGAIKGQSVVISPCGSQNVGR